jgi:hypothetical protein
VTAEYQEPEVESRKELQRNKKGSLRKWQSTEQNGMERRKTKWTVERKNSRSQICEQVASKKRVQSAKMGGAVVSHKSESGWNGLQQVGWYETTREIC